MYEFPPEDYKPRRVGWDCFNDLLQTRGCEAEQIDSVQDMWALSRVCSKHGSG